MRKFFHVLRHEIVLVQKDKRLEQLNQFFHSFQTALSLRQRSLPKRQRRGHDLNRLDDGALRRRRHPVITLFRNRDSVEAQAQPVFDALLGAVVLAVRQRSEFDGTPHVARIRHGSRQLIDRVIPALNYGSRD